MRGTITLSPPPPSPAPKAEPVQGLPWRSLGVVHPGQRREDLRRRPLLEPSPGPAVGRPAVGNLGGADPSQIDSGRGGGAVIRHYLRGSDLTVWAILVRDGRPLKALGPLSPEEQKQNPVRRIFSDGIDAAGFDLSVMTIVGERKWICCGARASL